MVSCLSRESAECSSAASCRKLRVCFSPFTPGAVHIATLIHLIEGALQVREQPWTKAEQGDGNPSISVRGFDSKIVRDMPITVAIKEVAPSA